jgi:outer membrane receptor protein involved in Fe transport
MTAEQYGNTMVPPEFVTGVQTVGGGNPDLDPETADTVTLGFVFDISDTMRLSRSLRLRKDGPDGLDLGFN